MALDNPAAAGDPSLQAPAPKKLLLWPSGIPDTASFHPAEAPTMTIFAAPPKLASGAAILLCPGGGYSQHTPFECEPVAAWLNKLGITACLLRYRLGPRFLHPAPVQDAARALKMMRALAGQIRVDPNRIGIVGFSAGGHLASTLCTRFTEGEKSSVDPVDRFSSRPDLALLIYPVITLQSPHTNLHTRKHLLGETPEQEMIDHLSNENHVTRRHPPTFLFHTTDDAAVPVENSITYFGALRHNAVPAEIHLYEKGPHGAGLANDNPALSTWPILASRWLASRGYGNGA